MIDDLLHAARHMVNDYQTSEGHHPDHVLVPIEAFKRMQSALEEVTPKLDAVYLIPRELTDEEWGEVAYNVNRKTNQGMTTIPIWVLQEVLKYANFIAGHRARTTITSRDQRPIAYTSKAQLKRMKADPGQNYIMWGEPLPYHEDIPLFATPTTPDDSMRIDDVIALAREWGEDSQPGSEYWLACNDIIEELNKRRQK